MANLKYDESFPGQAEQYAGEGLPDVQIAAKMGISPASFYSYQKQFPEFAEALERGRENLVGLVENRLLQLALGNCVITTKVVCSDGSERTTTRPLPPNLNAIKYFLERHKRQVPAAAYGQGFGNEYGFGAHDMPSPEEIAAAETAAMAPQAVSNISKMTECATDTALEASPESVVVPPQAVSNISKMTEPETVNKGNCGFLFAPAVYNFKLSSLIKRFFNLHLGVILYKG